LQPSDLQLPSEFEDLLSLFFGQGLLAVFFLEQPEVADLDFEQGDFMAAVLSHFP
jgi:hypothetical protein